MPRRSRGSSSAPAIAARRSRQSLRALAYAQASFPAIIRRRSGGSGGASRSADAVTAVVALEADALAAFRFTSTRAIFFAGGVATRLWIEQGTYSGATLRGDIA